MRTSHDAGSSERNLGEGHRRHHALRRVARRREAVLPDDVQLRVVFEDRNSAVFRIGDTLINLLQIEAADELIAPARVASRDAGSRHVFTIEVADVDAMCAELTSRGVTLLNGPMDRPWGIRTASFEDPAGNIWEIAS